MENKIRLIDEMIEGIIVNAIENYTKNWEQGKITDWENGYYKTEEVPYRNFKDLYSNFKFDLNSTTEEALDFIIKYLKEESKYTRYDDLDRELYTISEIEEIVAENK